MDMTQDKTGRPLSLSVMATRGSGTGMVGWGCWLAQAVGSGRSCIVLCELSAGLAVGFSLGLVSQAWALSFERGDSAARWMTDDG